MIKHASGCIVTILALSILGVSSGDEISNSAADFNGKQVAPDGSQLDRDQTGPLAIPFGTEKSKSISTMTGKILSVSGKHVQVIDSRGRTRVFFLTEETVITDPQSSSGVIIKKGDSISFQFDNKTRHLKKIQILQ